ncbi:hypothetical protein SLEP1_g41614 [Rubroshorea leprosula]|uniref:Uncharacterized protein n=1 Tax=Rubroshorea leprosula TaxID=152421 RepID=A0AAV5L7Q9_9ROSI|nr:hypothetical protein SLEP1_g41614 [Rubroshorea leprosula]
MQQPLFFFSSPPALLGKSAQQHAIEEEVAVRLCSSSGLPINPFSRPSVASTRETSLTLKAVAGSFNFFFSTVIPNFPRIPSMLKMRDEWAYKPHEFSFGPWHFHEPKLMLATEQFKEMLFEGLIQRLVERQHVNVEVDMSVGIREILKNARSDKKRELEEAIKAVGSKARECYEGDTNVTQEEFHKLLLLDGCFVIELCRKGAGEVSIQESEYKLFSSGMILTIYHDLFLLENQIPWFILEHLFDKTRGPESRMTLVELAITFIRSAFSLDDDQHPITKELLASGSSIVHIVDLTGRYLGSSAKKRKEQQPKQSQSRINWGCCLGSSAKERKEQRQK